jgi:hypothetical protein
MSTETELPAEHTAKHRSPAECKPLIDAAGKDLFRQNAFRITGLSVDATIREITKHADKLKLMAEFGQGESVHTSAFALRPPPTLDQIREATEKLKDPEKRLVDEFFWFWPLVAGRSQTDTALQAIARDDMDSALETWSSLEHNHGSGVIATHNLALAYHLAALDWETWGLDNETDERRQKKIATYWREAFRRWHRLADDDSVWEQVVARVRATDDQRLSTGFVRRMRASLPLALGKINAELALTFAEAGKIELAQMHIQFMRQTLNSEGAERMSEMVLRPAKVRLRALLDNTNRLVDANPAMVGETTRALINTVRPTLYLFDLFFDDNAHDQKDILDEMANACVNHLVVYQRKTGDNEVFVELLQMTLPLAVSAEIRQRIEKNILIGKNNIKLARSDFFYSLLKSIDDSKETPSKKLSQFRADIIPAIIKLTGVSGYSLGVGYLSTGSEDYSDVFNSAAVVLRDISIAAWNEHKDMETAAAALDLALKHACSAELVQRLEDDQATLQRMRTTGGLHENSISTTPHVPSTDNPSAPPKKKNLIPLGWGMFIVFLLIYWANSYISSTDRTANNVSGTFHNPAPSSGVSTPIYNPLPSSGSVPSSGYAPSFSPPQSPAPTYLPSPQTQVPSSYSSESESTHTFRIPHRYSAELNSDAQIIERERVLGNLLKAELERLKREIESERLLLDRTSQYAINAYNAKVDLYNAKLQERRNQLQRFNQMVDNYNNKLRQYGR